MSEMRRLGKIEVTTRAVATLAGRAVSQCYGVVGMASKTLRDGLAVMLQWETPHRGIEVRFVENGAVVIDLYVIMEYGMRVSEVANSIMSGVKFAIARSLEVHQIQVNVFVQGIRVSNTD